MLAGIRLAVGSAANTLVAASGSGRRLCGRLLVNDNRLASLLPLGGRQTVAFAGEPWWVTCTNYERWRMTSEP